MKYENITRAVFLNRLNRFIAEVEIGSRKEMVHVKNTGRCKELLLPGSEVWLTAPKTPGRKTNYDLVAVRKANGILFNIDSQAPNQAVKEWLSTVRPNVDTHPEFGTAMEDARTAGVQILCLSCYVEPDMLVITESRKQ